MHDELNMKSFFYTLSVVMVVAWALGYYVYSFGTSVHVLLFLALIVGLMGIVKKE